MRMTLLVEPSLYNGLPTLEEAEDKIRAIPFDDQLNGPIRDVFLKHGCQEHFCVCLQHAHHLIRDGEAVVKVAGTAHIMNRQAMDEIINLGNKIAPTTWMTAESGIAPMELAVFHADEDIPGPADAFLADFLSILKANGCDGLLGIDTICQYDWAETSIGEASVVVRSIGSRLDGFVAVAFAFKNDEPSYKVHGKCKRSVQHTSKKN